MPGLHTDLIMHHLSILPGIKPIKQKLRKMHPHVALLVKAKQAIDYAKWISKIVLVSKHDKLI